MWRFLSVALVSACCMGAAQAQPAGANWPSRPIHFIVPFPAGSITDLVSRIVATKLGEQLGQTIVVENRVGASGAAGAEAVQRAAPDGYTMGLATASTHAIGASLNPSLPYDPVKDFAPVSMVGDAPYALVVSPKLPANDVAQFVALAKQKPRTLTYSTVGPASLAQFAGALFSSMTGTELVSIPYRSATQAVLDLREARIDAQFGAIAASLAFVREGTLRALAVTSQTRVSALPNVPTLSESGLPGYEAVLWMAVVMPPKTPPALVDRVSTEMRAVLADEGVKKALAAQVVQPRSSTPDELRDRIRSDVVKWRKIAAEAGIKPE